MRDELSRSLRGSFNRGPDFAWSELLFAVPLTALVPAIATPAPARLNADIRTFAAAVKDRIQPLSSCL